jgi:tetratricopeptide (TPR) repeat protein
MAQEQAKQLLQQGIAAARGGQADVARQLFRQAARFDPRNEAAWQWLITVAEDNNERVFCLKQLLAINPQNDRARDALQRLSAEPATPAPAPAAGEPEQRSAPTGIGVPALDDDKYARLQQAADDFLRRYNPEPVDRLNIQWVQKRKGRYGEGGATRLRRMTYAAAVLLVLIAVGGLVFLVNQVGLPGSSSGGNEVSLALTRIPTGTPLPGLTPMAGDEFATPFPSAMAVLATSVPTGVERGDPYGLKTPTEIYPHVEADVQYAVQQAANYYAVGDYATALEMLQKAREENKPGCYPSLVYFEALSMAHLGNYQQATQTVQDAQNEQVPRSYTSCQAAPLLLAGLAEIAYLQDPQSQSALAYSEQALTARLDPPLAQAGLIKARVELAQGNVAAARGTVAQALENWPQDTNLLLLAAQIELANNQPQVALGYVGKTLFIAPALQPALYLQTDIYLKLAEQSQVGDQRLEYYGLAALSAQTIQLYYAGDPEGYLYLAKARLGEGKDNLAETALDRILAVEDSLPDSALAVIQEAHRVRGDLYYQQGRFEEALTDYDAIKRDDPVAAVRVVDINFRLDDYLKADLALNDLLVEEPKNATYLLLHARLYVEACTFHPEQLSCDYRGTLRVLTDNFIAQLDTNAQRADAYAYRGQAQYRDTQARGASLSTGERRTNYQLALNDLTQALTVRESPVDHYSRGLILEELNDLPQAYDEYQWVTYWGNIYSYPFEDGNFEQRVARVAAAVQEVVNEAAVTPAPSAEATVEVTSTLSPATATPRPTSTSRPTVTPTPTITPTPTALPPEEIP